nr:cytohesin-2 [Pelodiscus sinensis]|eukprot:XP_025034909.1 cytohesin-2 [Pelodiscus sinensis]
MEDGVYVPPDLTPEERLELENIRRRKQELLVEIQRLRDELSEAMNEVEGLEANEGRWEGDTWAGGWEPGGVCPRAPSSVLSAAQGIQFLVENELLHNTPEEIARFLYKGEGLNKTAIGDYLGERQFLWSFRLPGEAQKIDRMMEAFAQRYCLCNPGVFQCTDTCYVLSFAVIMLNTSLHNPNVRDKPTVERFITMNRGINDGGDLPEELLRNLYDSIRNEPFKIPEDDGNDLTHTFFNPDREGWLLKLGSEPRDTATWKRRWFILTDNCLYYFEYTTDKEPRGIIPLENLSIREVEDPRKPVRAAPRSLPPSPALSPWPLSVCCQPTPCPSAPPSLFSLVAVRPVTCPPSLRTPPSSLPPSARPFLPPSARLHHPSLPPHAPSSLPPHASIIPPSLRTAAVSVDPFYEMLAARKKRISVKKKQEQA